MTASPLDSVAENRRLRIEAPSMRASDAAQLDPTRLVSTWLVSFSGVLGPHGLRHGFDARRELFD